MSDRGQLVVVSGPSGAGKSTVISKAVSVTDKLRFSISATTRAPRSGEAHGREYFFVDRDEFIRMIDGAELLEYAEYVGNYYGTPKAQVLDFLDRGVSVVLDIEVCGAMQVKRAMPDAVMVFLVPSSFSELEKRLRGRNKDSSEVIAGRISKAKAEYGHIPEYDYIIINDDTDEAVNELLSIITAEKCKTAKRIKSIT